MHAVTLVAVACLLVSAAFAQVKFALREIDDPLPNPDIGWETFHVTAK